MPDEADQDPEDRAPPPRVAQHRGKTPVQPPIQILSDGNNSDDDC